MNNCYWCNKVIVTQLDWLTVIIGRREQLLCQDCVSQLQLIEKDVCEKCFKPSNETVCSDCKMWTTNFSGNDPLIKNISTYYYNEFLKDIVAKWKYRGDYVLGNVFANDIKFSINKYYKNLLKEAVIVPIPLSKNRLLERGFNQAEQLAQFLIKDKRQMLQLFERVSDEKQAKKSRSERIFTKNPFILRQNTNNFVILVDDIYTTGTTLRHAALLLKENGCPAVYSYTLIRG
jgi:competence protein ComFC